MKKSNTPKAFIITMFSIALFSFVGKVNAQDTQIKQKASVQKSFFGLQVGLLEAKVLYEFRLADKFTLRNEFGFDGTMGKAGNENPFWRFSPTFTVEPRFYYSLNNRLKNNKSIERNSGMFIALNTNFQPNWFQITNGTKYPLVDIYSVSSIPTWGFRKNINKKMNFETAVGFGYRYNFGKDLSHDYGDWAINLRLRIGFDFRVR